MSKELMTIDEMRKIILKNFPFSELKKGAGIHEFYQDGNLSIGVCYEDTDEEENVYIYNLFAMDEYINISGYGNAKDLIPHQVLSELTDNWNKFKNHIPGSK